MLVKIARGVARYCENKTVIPELREEDFFQNCSISAKKPIVATADESLGSSACFWSPPIFDFIQTPRNEMVQPQAVSVAEREDCFLFGYPLVFTPPLAS